MAGEQGQWGRLTLHYKCVFVVYEYFNKWIHFIREKRSQHLPLLFFVLCYVNEEKGDGENGGGESHLLAGMLGEDVTGDGKFWEGSVENTSINNGIFSYSSCIYSTLNLPLLHIHHFL